MWRASCVNLQWANWNVRTLYSAIHIREDGTVKLTGKEPQKIDDLCEVLGQHNITLAAISEHRWRGEGTYTVNEHWKFVYSGLPLDAPKAQSGVGFMLHSSLWGAWRDAGEFCHAEGARLLKIRLKIAGRFFSVISVYAPTFQCSDAEKDRFYDDLNALVSAVEAKDELIVMGDFNARVGIKDTGEDTACGLKLRDVVGTHGLPEVNDNGARLLEYCASQRRHKMRIMSTCFKHKEYGTWFHPSSRKWFQIDHVLCSARTGGLVKDVQSMVGYEHNTDHRCVKVKLRIPPKRCVGRFYNKSGEHGRDGRPPRLQVDRLQEQETCDAFNQQLHELATEGFFDEGYPLFGHALRVVAQAKLGTIPSQRLAPWKIANQAKLAALSDEKKQARDPTNPNSQQYKQACQKVKKATQKLLNDWWAQKAETIQQMIDSKDHNYQFAGYRELRSILVRHKGVSVKLRDAKGNLLFTKSARGQRWREYFSELLNVPAGVSQVEMDTITSREPAVALDAVPSFAETLVAIGKLIKGKAAGPDGISPEVLQALDNNNARLLHETFCRVWEGIDPMPNEWREAFLVPLPKKGDLQLCKNWRGILLASVPGKVFSRIINGRLQVYCEQADILPDSQCGFRAGRGVMDMIFTLKMAMEVAAYKSHPFHVLFIDLVKAYDSVSRAGLWAILRKKGVPPRLRELIRQFYSDKKAQVSVEGVLSSMFDLATGLGQGCCLAPLLFNVFLSAVMEAWQRKSGGGVQWLTKIDGMLGHREVMDKYSSWTECHFEDLTYADDSALIVNTLLDLRQKAVAFQAHLALWGLTLSVDKTKALTTDPVSPEPVVVAEHEGLTKIKFVDVFEYLGVLITAKGTSDQAVRQRIEKARKAFWALDSSVWRVAQLSLATKMRVYRACVMSVLMFGAETWTPTWLTVKALERFHMICLRKISGRGLRFQREHFVSNENLRAWLQVPTIKDLTRQARVRWLGHVGRMNDERLPKKMLHGWLPQALGTPRLPGKQPGKFFRETVAADLGLVGLPKTGWLQLCQSEEGKRQWRLAVQNAAVWGKPQVPQPGKPPARRVLSGAGRSGVKRRQGHGDRIQLAEKRIKEDLEPASKFLRWESRHGGRETCQESLRPLVQTVLDESPAIELEEVVHNLFEGALGDAVDEWDTEADYALGRMCVATAYYAVVRGVDFSGGTQSRGVTPRRVRRKQAKPAWHLKQEREQAALPLEQPRVRSKYWGKSSFIQKQGGRFVCPIPGCGKAYTTKFGLAHHQILQHREGTFREKGFDCPHCPRNFDRESALTTHLSKVHTMAHPYTCPFCKGLWPGPASLRLHIASDHKFFDHQFPGECPLCVEEKGNSETFKSVHQFKYHLKRSHLV